MTWICCKCKRWNTIDLPIRKKICEQCNHKRCFSCKTHKKTEDNRNIDSVTIFSGMLI